MDELKFCATLGFGVHMHLVWTGLISISANFCATLGFGVHMHLVRTGLISISVNDSKFTSYWVF